MDNLDLAGVTDNESQDGSVVVSYPHHKWTEDGATFCVTDTPHRLYLGGSRFTGGTITSNEAVLAREILRLSERVEELGSDVRVARMAAQSRVEGVTDRANAKILTTEEENLRLTDRVNALTARIEEALDLILSKTEESGKIAEAYRKLERVLLDKVK